MKSKFNRGEIALALLEMYDIDHEKAFEVAQSIYQFWNEADLTEQEVRTMLEIKDQA